MNGYQKPVNSWAAAVAAAEVSLEVLEHGVEKAEMKQKSHDTGLITLKTWPAIVKILV